MGRRSRVLLLAALAVVLVACDPSWPTLGYGPSHDGNNPTESTIDADNVGQLVKTWSAALPGGPEGSSPVVADGTVFVTAAGRLLAFSADGSAGCSGAPKTCEPIWSAAQGGAASPTVAGGVVFTTSGGSLWAFDSSGTTGCSGTPKVCAPLWQAPVGTNPGAPTVAGGVVYVGSDEYPNRDPFFAFDAHGSEGCSGTPKVCAPLWRAARPAGPTAAVANGLVYTAAFVRYGDVTFIRMSAFDAAGSEGCSGTPKACVPVWVSQEEAFDETLHQPPSVADGRVYLAADAFCHEATGQSLYFVYDAAGQQSCVDGLPRKCPPPERLSVDSQSPWVEGPAAFADGHAYLTGGGMLHSYTTADPHEVWRATLGGMSSASVANGVVYSVSISFAPDLIFAAAYDATGTRNCTGSPTTCEPLWRSGARTFDSGDFPWLDHWAPPVVTGGTVYVRLGKLSAYRLPG